MAPRTDLVTHEPLSPGSVHVLAARDEWLVREVITEHHHIAGLYEVGDFGHARAAKTRPEATGQLPRWDLEDPYASANALWECLTQVGRPAEDGELMPGWLHAVLGRALMTDPSQRWADMTALVDAIERGRGATAAAPVGARLASASPSAPSGVSGLAIAATEDGQFGAAAQRWRELARKPTELGRAASRLPMLDSSRPRPASSG